MPRATGARLPWDKNWKGFGKDLEKDLTLGSNTPDHRSAGAADIEDALRASTAAPSLRELSRGTLPKKIKEKVLKKL